MSNWTSGYVAEIDYTYGYYPELNPLRSRIALLNQGIVVPVVTAACELGFGQGLSVNLHAAASGIAWHGTDFNPAQASFARDLAADTGARLDEAAFAEFCARSDLPDFDFVGLHGIWSWIADESRHVIVDFLKRKLKPGGLVYVSYNTLPGWAGFAPMRHLMVEHAEAYGAKGRGIVDRIDGALQFADRLLAANPAYARAHPQLADRLAKTGKHDRNYLAHEYFNRDWHPMHVATMARWLEPAKLGFAASAHGLDHIDGLNLTVPQQDLLREVADPVFRETVRDFMVNQQFRRDYWIKGARRLNGLERAEALRAERVVLVAPRADVSLKISGMLGEATMSEAVYAPLLDALADHQPRSLGEIEAALKERNIRLPQIVEAALLLTGTGSLAPAQEETVSLGACQRTGPLNARLCHRARGSGDIGHLASPVTGGGVAVGRFQQLFLLARQHGRNTPAEWARFVWDLLAAQGQRLVRDGKPIDAAEANLAELTAQATAFADKRLSMLQVLKVA